jgi:predicted dehydrogenase
LEHWIFRNDLKNVSQIGVGLIGIQPNRSWGAVAHLPAVRQLPDRYTIAGIANSTEASAVAAARELGDVKAFSSPEELVTSAAVDLVAITVKVPHHAKLVRLALGAGKHVFCEWPLAVSIHEAEELAALGSRAGLVTAIGTQAVFAPAINALSDLVQNRKLGHVYSSTLVGNGMTWGAKIEQRNTYLLDAANGATMLTIAVGHALSAIEAVLGRISSVSATIATRRQSVMVLETGEQLALKAPDQILLACALEDGTPLSLHYRGGLPRGEGLVWDIDGSEGSARLSGSSGLLEMAPLSLSVCAGPSRAWETMIEPVAQPAVDGVRRLYVALADKICGGDSDVPDFSTALRLHRLIAAIEKSAETGRRTTIVG